MVLERVSDGVIMWKTPGQSVEIERSESADGELQIGLNGRSVPNRTNDIWEASGVVDALV